MNMGTAMSRMIFVSAAVRGSQDIQFCRLIRLRLRFGRFTGAVAAIRERTSWETDAEAIRQLAITMHCFARAKPENDQPYRCARFLYRRVASLTNDATLQAEAVASTGSAYLEQQRVTDADHEYGASLVLDPCNRFALLGRLAVACAQGDADEIRSRCSDLITRVPTWHADHGVVVMLATDPSYAALRDCPRLFVGCFGGSPEDLQALHRQHRVTALLDNLCHGGDPANSRDHSSAALLDEPSETISIDDADGECLFAAYQEVERSSPLLRDSVERGCRISFVPDGCLDGAH